MRPDRVRLTIAFLEAAQVSGSLFAGNPVDRGIVAYDSNEAKELPPNVVPVAEGRAAKRLPVHGVGEREGDRSGVESGQAWHRLAFRIPKGSPQARLGTRDRTCLIRAYGSPCMWSYIAQILSLVRLR
jgi:hypothetical protein